MHQCCYRICHLQSKLQFSWQCTHITFWSGHKCVKHTSVAVLPPTFVTWLLFWFHLDLIRIFDSVASIAWHHVKCQIGWINMSPTINITSLGLHRNWCISVLATEIECVSGRYPRYKVEKQDTFNWNNIRKRLNVSEAFCWAGKTIHCKIVC